MTRAVGLSTFNVRYKLNCISMWLCVVHLGLDQITARLQYYMTLVSSRTSTDLAAVISMKHMHWLVHLKLACDRIKYASACISGL